MNDIYKVILGIIGFAIGIVLCALLTSCKTQQPIVHQVTKEVTKEVYITDTLVAFRPDTATLHALLQCDSMGQILIAQLAQQQGTHTAINARLQRTDNGTAVTIDCKQDSLQQLVTKLRERITTADTNHQTETRTIEVIPNYYRNCTRGFWVLLIIALATAAILIWRNWASIAAWIIKIYTKLK